MMEKIKRVLLILMILAGGNLVMAEELKQPFAIGEINPYNKYFTGTTHLNMLVTRDEIFNSSIGNVTFDAGARTNWHKH